MPYASKEKAKEQGQKYRLQHKDEIKVRQRSWYLRNKEHLLNYYRSWQKANPKKCREYERVYELRLKTEVLAYYGGGTPTCVVCGEARLACLSIDHIEGGGSQHRKAINNRGGRAFYRWLRINSYPEGYQTLCMNCQFIKKAARKQESGCSVKPNKN